MKKSYIITSFLALSPMLHAQEATAEAPAAKPAAPADDAEDASKPGIEKLREISRQFANLPEDKRQQYLQLRNEASQLFQNKRIFETLEIVRQMEIIFKNDPQLLNLRGACYVELRNFQAARETFNEAIDITGETSSILFNLAEIEFVTDNWQKAIDIFSKVRALTNEKQIQMIHLVDFKILLCHIKLSEDKSLTAEKRAEHKQQVPEYADKVDRFADSPYYYYANAARFYYLGEQQKADQLLSSGRRIFSASPQITASWEDTLVEFGYIKSYLSDKEDEADSSLGKP